MVLEGVIDQREVQHSWGFGLGWVTEQTTLLRLALLLRAGGDGWERDALLLAEPAQKLQLLLGRQRGHQRASQCAQHKADYTRPFTGTDLVCKHQLGDSSGPGVPGPPELVANNPLKAGALEKRQVYQDLCGVQAQQRGPWYKTEEQTRSSAPRSQNRVNFPVGEC